MKKSAINAMLSDLVSELDYDIWKSLFVEECMEEPEEAALHLKRMRNVVRRHLEKECPPTSVEESDETP
jgi:hypothetical protein